MAESHCVFVDVDTQRDFLDPSGALFIEGSEAILNRLERLTLFARDRGIPIIATACDHTPDDPEFQVFPPHCVSGTSGQERILQTRFIDSLVLPVTRPYAGERPLHLTLSKSRYDVFHREDASELFAKYAEDGNAVFVVYGVATDYCVRCVVMGLLDRGHRVEVVVDAIRPVDPVSEAEVLTEFVKRGASLTLTERVCGD